MNTRQPKSSVARNRRLQQKRSTGLQFERLEARNLLAAITVSNHSDLLSLTADTSSIPALIANDGGDGISLREAIAAADNTLGEDSISFDASVFTGGRTSLIRLTQGQLEINDSLTIDASSVGGVVITGDANGDDITIAGSYITDASASFGEYAGEPNDRLDDNSRVINFSNSSAALTLTSLTITGGRETAEDEDGGGIRSFGDLSLNSSNVSGNSTAGRDGHGGGISSRSSNVTLTNSTISGNRTTGGLTDGGGVSNALGNLTVLNSTVTGNFSDSDGGGLYARGILTLANSTVKGNEAGGSGGGIFATGALSLTDSTVSENFSVFNGGGILGSGTISLTNSTVNENSAVRGGGIYGSGTTSLVNSTVSGNSAFKQGGGILALNDVSLTNSTVTGNSIRIEIYGSGGGISTNGLRDTFSNLTLNNSIVSGNTTNTNGSAPDVSLAVGDSLTVEHTLIGDTTGSGISATTGSGNILNQAALLGPLADNGGATLTHALVPGSPAIDAGDNALAVDENGNSLITDQRENGRIGSGTVDIGAIEFNIQAPIFPVVLGDINLDSEVNFLDISPFINLLVTGSFQDEADINRDGVVNFVDVGPFIKLLSSSPPMGVIGSLVVTTNLDIVDPSDNLNSLREAIAFANDPTAGLGGDGDADGDGLATDTITFDASAFTGGGNNLIRLTQGELLVTDSLSIDGAAVGGVLITGDADDDDVTIAGTDITDVSASFGGTTGATSDRLDDNSRVLKVAPGLADLTLEGLTITGGRTTDSGDGGGIEFGSHGALTLIDSEVSGNSSDGEGGGISSFGDTLLTNSIVSENVSSSSGGGVNANEFIAGGSYGGVLGSTVTFNNSVLRNNSSENDGGGVHATGDVSFNNSIISGNSSAGRGGGFSGSVGSFPALTLTFNYSTISGNSSGGAGGGIWADGDASFNNSTISGNNSGGAGGGVSAIAGSVSLTNSTISGNSSAGDGGGASIRARELSLTNSTVSGNVSAGDGGGLQVRSSKVLLLNSTVANNSAAGVGGGIFGQEPTSTRDIEILALHNSIVSGNTDNGTAPDVDAVSDPLNDLTVEHSLIGDTTGSGITAATGTGNILNQSALLGPLADNGGTTLTHALLPGSPAINAGNNGLAVNENGNPLTTDQRGGTRVESGTVDIGAFERSNSEFFSNLEQLTFADTSSDGQPLVAFYTEEASSATAELFTADHDALDEVFGFQFEELLPEIIG